MERGDSSNRGGRGYARTKSRSKDVAGSGGLAQVSSSALSSGGSKTQQKRASYNNKTKKRKREGSVQKVTVKKPRTTTTTTTKASTTPLSKNLNIQRDLPKTFVCNGQVIHNPFKPITAARDVKSCTCYHSVYNIDSSGKLRSNLIDGLVKVIRTYGASKNENKKRSVVGCVAWLNNPDVLNALKDCLRVAIIVNGENYKVFGNGKMLEEYAKLPKFNEPLGVAFSHLHSVLDGIENNRTKGKSKYASVRAFGNAAFSTTTGAPRTKGNKGGAMGSKKNGGLEHNKYLVFFEEKLFKRRVTHPVNQNWQLVQQDEEYYSDAEGEYEYQNRETPCAVWTGSMNVTKASEGHHENAVFIESCDSAKSYFHDWAMTFMSSTPVGSTNKKATPLNCSKTNLH
jgi:hypothetical protein